MAIDVQWPLVMFTFLTGIGGGMMIPVGLSEFSNSAWKGMRLKISIASMILLVVGGCASVLHLASPQNVMAAATNLGSFSGVSIELMLLAAMFIGVLAYAVVIVRRPDATRARRALGVVCIVFALLLLFFCGHGYVMPSRPQWDSNVLPLAYLGTALAASAFAYCLFLLFDKDAPAGGRLLKTYVLAATIASAATCLLYAAWLGSDTGAEFPVTFWGSMIGCGVALCLAAGIAFYMRGERWTRPIVIAGFVIACVGALSVRIMMWQTSVGYLSLFDSASIASYIIP